MGKDSSMMKCKMFLINYQNSKKTSWNKLINHNAIHPNQIYALKVTQRAFILIQSSMLRKIVVKRWGWNVKYFFLYLHGTGPNMTKFEWYVTKFHTNMNDKKIESSSKWITH